MDDHINDYIIACSIFVCTFGVVCIVYDCIMTSRLQLRMRETWDFIHSMTDVRETPERVPFLPFFHVLEFDFVFEGAHLTLFAQ